MLNNQVQIVGNVGRAPEVFTTDSGRKVLTFSVCINEKFKKDDQLVERANWIPCVCFQEARVKYLEENLRSGAYVLVAGRLSENTYTSKKYFDAGGTAATIHELQLVVDEFLLLDGKPKQSEEPAPEPVPEEKPKSKAKAKSVADENEETGF